MDKKPPTTISDVKKIVKKLASFTPKEVAIATDGDTTSSVQSSATQADVSNARGQEDISTATFFRVRALMS